MPAPGQPVRVLWLIKGLGPGGAEQLLLNQAVVRDRAAIDVHAAFLVPAKNHLVADLTDEGVSITLLDGPRGWDPRWVLRLRALLTSERIDVVHVHSPLVAAGARLAVRSLPAARRPAMVSTEHNIWARHTRLTRFANRSTLRFDDERIAVSAGVRDSMHDRWRAGVRVILHGVNLEAVRQRSEQRQRIREELGASPSTIVIGTVANYRREKAYDVLLDAASRFFSLVPDGFDVRFVAVGQGPLESEIQARHEELGLGDRFLLTGYRPDATTITAAFDIFTLASRHEGLPVALMDALALGIPVVATNVGGIPEAITNDREGILVEPDDPTALAQAWAALAQDATRRARYADAAGVASERFDITAAQRELEGIYLDVAERNRS